MNKKYYDEILLHLSVKTKFSFYLRANLSIVLIFFYLIKLIINLNVTICTSYANI